MDIKKTPYKGLHKAVYKVLSNKSNGDEGEHSGKSEPHHRLAKSSMLSGYLLICYLLPLIGTPRYLTRYLNQFISRGRLSVSIMMRSFCMLSY